LTMRRRSLYFAHHGEAKMQFLELFDAANPCDCYRRTVSVVPQQALALANSELTRRAAGTLAAKLPGGEAMFVRAAFEQGLGRPPTPAEQSASAAFLSRQAKLLRESDQPDPETRARANLVHALFNHNDFVTVR